MKKTLLTTTAAALFILSLTGCAGTAEPVQTTEDRPPAVIRENVSEPTEAVESAQIILSAGNTQLVEDNADTEDTGSQEKLATPAEPSSTPAPQATTAPETAPAPQATPKPQASQAPQAIPVPEETQAPTKGTTIQFNVTTQKGTEESPSPEPSTTPKPEPTPVPTPPAQSNPPVESTAPAFNINHWISYAQSYAKGAGLNLDSTATACWDNPIAAGAHCAYLERDIQSRLNRYAKDESISDVWIWAESRSDGSYDFYIGYA